MANTDDRVQVRITADGKHFIPEGYVRKDQVLWVTRERADTLINKQRIAEPAAAKAGPTEFKPAGPTEKNASAGGEPASRSIDSVRSSETGLVPPSSASQADPASQSSSAARPRARGSGTKTSE